MVKQHLKGISETNQFKCPCGHTCREYNNYKIVQKLIKQHQKYCNVAIECQRLTECHVFHTDNNPIKEIVLGSI